MLDVDGVLVDGRPSDGKRWTSGLQEDLGIDPADLGRVFFAREWKDIVVGQKDLMRSLAKSLVRLPSRVTANELVAYWFEMDSRIVTSVLSDCIAAQDNGISVFLATNQEHERAAYLMETMGLKSHVNGIVYSAEAGVQKPHPDFYSYAVSRSGFEPHELLLVDDTPVNIDGARQAGWHAVHWGGSDRLSDIVHRHISR